MKKTFLVPVMGLAATGLVGAQGLYNIMPYDDEPAESLPIHWTVNANIGWDDNPAPFGSDVAGFDSDESLYVSASVQGNFVSATPQTTWDVWGRVGVTYYIDEVTQTSVLGVSTADDDTFYQAAAGVNFVHRVSERLRLRSRNNVSYEQEPDYDQGIATDRRDGSYTRYSSDNSVGYRWTERLGTVTGYRVHGTVYDEVDNQDYISHIFYNQFRYRVSPATVLTASYRYGIVDNDSAPDSDSHYLLVGAEHQFSSQTVGVVRVGGQYYSPDNGDSSWSPYIEATLKTQVNEQFGLRGFLYYGIEDRGRNLWTHDAAAILPMGMGVPTLVAYDERHTLRIGTQASYQVSPTLTLFGGLNYINDQYEEGTFAQGGVGSSPDFDESTFNINLGASLQVAENIYVTGTYNYTTADSDSDLREYDRNRFQLGVQASF